MRQSRRRRFEKFRSPPVLVFHPADVHPKSRELRDAWVVLLRLLWALASWRVPYTTPIAMAAEPQAASDTPVRIAQSRTSPNRRRSTLIEPASIAGGPAAAARRWKERLVGVDHRAEPVLSLFVVFCASVITSSLTYYEATGHT